MKLTEQEHPVTGCDGCRFTPGHAERCKTCSRRYADRWEAPPPPKPLSKGAMQVLTMALVMAEQAGFDIKRGC